MEIKLGEHEGIINYTIGQRKGIKISRLILFMLLILMPIIILLLLVKRKLRN